MDALLKNQTNTYSINFILKSHSLIMIIIIKTISKRLT